MELPKTENVLLAYLNQQVNGCLAYQINGIISAVMAGNGVMTGLGQDETMIFLLYGGTSI